jgi:hypothetical protein
VSRAPVKGPEQAQAGKPPRESAGRVLAYPERAASALWWWLGEPEPISEWELSWIWSGQRFPAQALKAVDGRELRVLNPGRRGGSAGPDYLDAVFLLGGEERRGDVELHVRASSFRLHGHDTDPAYDSVALHVVFRADTGGETRLSNGAAVPVAAFAPWLEGRTEEIKRWMGAAALWQEPCREARARLGNEAVQAALRSAGERRFRARVEALAVSVGDLGLEEALWRVLLDCLGVGGDRQGFRRLAVAFPASLARRLVEREDSPGERSDLAGALCHVAGLAESLEPKLDLPPPLRPALAGNGRPANRPQRRLQGLARLLEKAGGDLAAYAVEGVSRARRPREIIAAWQVAGRNGKALLGPDRARELALNVALPAAALQPALQARALELAAALPASPAYGKTGFLESNLRLADGRRGVSNALEQQGLLSLLGQWCSQGGCGRCPLSAREP